MTETNTVPGVFEITFYDRDVKRTHYARESGYYERLIAQHGHLHGLSVEPLELNSEQRIRWDGADDLSDYERVMFALYSTTLDEDDSRFDAAAYRRYALDQAEPQVKAQRKRAEARGVTVNGIRYAGDAGNRQALSEAVQMADDSGNTSFQRWKDSDGEYHSGHPVDDVRQALRLIGKRRSELIELEAQHIAAIVDDEADPLDLDWTTQYD